MFSSFIEIDVPAAWIAIDTTNKFDTCKHAFSSFPPYYALLQAFFLSLKEICIAKPNFALSLCCVTNIFKCDKPTVQ
jgi:hypothetical protein